MAEYIPLEDIREALEGGTTPSGQPCRHPFGAQPATRSSWNGVRRRARNPEVIAALLMLAICVGTFVKIYLDTGRL